MGRESLVTIYESGYSFGRLLTSLVDRGELTVLHYDSVPEFDVDDEYQAVVSEVTNGLRGGSDDRSQLGRCARVA